MKILMDIEGADEYDGDLTIYCLNTVKSILRIRRKNGFKCGKYILMFHKLKRQ